MARKIIDVGTIGNDGTGDSIRDSFRKVNDNFRELYSSLGLGERLSFIGLADAPDSYVGVNNAINGATPLVTVNNQETGVQFKNLIAGTGISIDWGTSNGNDIVINSIFSDVSGDPSPQLGGDLSARFGGDQKRILDLAPYDRSSTTPGGINTGFLYEDEAISKAYADGKISLAGVNFVDPATNTVNTAAGRMTGPLVLSRDPTDEDDIVYDGLVAATKRYVDNSSFGSAVNLYVATSGQDDRPGLSRELQGRALSYAYRTIEAALKRAEELVLESRFDIGPYKKILTFGGNVSGEVAISISNPTVFTATNHRLNVDAQVTFTTVGTLPGGVFADTVYYVLAEDLTANTFKVSTTIGGDPIGTTGTQSGTHRFRGTNTTRNNCTLTDIGVSPASGTGFVGKALMSADTITISNEGTNYRVGDILTFNLPPGNIAAGGEATRIEVLGVGIAGNILTFRVLSSGVYVDALPGSTNVSASDNSEFGQLATFNITYKVNNVYIDPANLALQSGYSLVSVRITGGGGAGAFGTAVVEAGKITSIIITDQGSGFTGIPTVEADLPRFFIRTDNYRTDFTGDVINDTPQAIRGRDLREGLFIRGETSGAIAQILSHNGELSNGVPPTYPAGTAGSEIFDVDIVFGQFQEGEVIAYGDVTKNVQISVLIESGIYEENFPLKIPQNVAIIGDEFRRVIIKPKTGASSSPWAFQKFRRDTVIDGMSTAVTEFGWHYLTDPEQPVYPKINNPGNKDAAAALLELNRTFLQNEMIAWIDYQITNNLTPFTTTFVYNKDLYRSNYGLLIDSIVFDMKYSGYNRTVSAALKYYQSSSGLSIITTQLDESLAGLDHLADLMVDIIDNTEITSVYQTSYPQIIDQAFISEDNADTVIGLLINTVKDIIDESGPGYGSVNQPKDNNELDVFLCNDANIVRAVTCQGHGGFMMVLDPEGQILTKSPYAQECASFSKSIDRQTFAGGQFVDGFSGNLQFQIQSKISNTRLVVTGLDRYPNLPCSFIVQDTVYRVNYVRDWVYNPAGSSAQLVLDDTTPWTFDIFTYDDAICSRDVGLIIDGLTYDLVFGTNYNTRKSGLTYRQANASVVIEDQKDITVRAIAYAHDLVNEVIFGTEYVTQQEVVESSKTTITRIVDRGTFFAPALTFTNPPGVDSNIVNAKEALLNNIDFIKDETVGWINAQIAGNIAPFTTSFVYESQTCARDVGYIIEALVYDILYGGNSATRDAGLKYYDGVGNDTTFQAPGQKPETAAAIDYVKYLTLRVVQNLAPASTYSSTPRIAATPTSLAVRNTIDTLITDISDIVTNGVGNANALTLPSVSSYAYNNTAKNARTAILAAKSSIQSQTVDWVDINGNLYELLMPGNRSMLANDFTQVNDMGYGIIATNGGLVEAVSMFTYYNYISYYSINGAQIRSIGGSSAHGVYALVAEGSDPLEVPTPTEIFFDLNQRVDCYINEPVYGSTYANTAGGLEIYVSNYDFTPLANSELEINHNNVSVSGTVISFTNSTKTITSSDVAKVNFLDAGFYKTQSITISGSSSNDGTYTVSSVTTTTLVVLESLVNESAGATVKVFGVGFGPVYRYPITSVSTSGLPSGVAKLTLTSDETGNFEGLFAPVQDGAKMTLRSNSVVVLTGDLVEVAVRPSTGLRLVESPDIVYRVLQFDTYSDPDGPYPISVSVANPGVFRVTTTVTTITGTDTCTTSDNHKLKVGDKFIPSSTANGFTANQTYYIIDTPAYNQFKVSTSPGGSSATLVNGTGLTITGVKTHRLLDNYTIQFSSSGTLPGGLNTSTVYYVSADDLSDITFKVSETRNGTPIAITNAGSGIHSYAMSGLTQTTLRENYDYLEFTLWEPGEYQTTAQPADSISIASPTVITVAAGHGLSVGDTIKFESSGTLPTGLTDDQHYFVLSTDFTSTSFKVSTEPEGTPINTTGGLLGGHSFGRISGHVGDTVLAVVPLGSNSLSRVVGSSFMWMGEEYVIAQYETEAQTGEAYARITLDRGLENNIISFASAYTLKSAVPTRTVEATGSLTIRIALTRVTSHDLLEIGTGSYADTNYPNEIYGQSVNALNDANEVEERDVGRVFYVTTDQFGNFSVGPFFRVDQGTGRVTFSAAIALSNLDGIGFKRGVPISEFSTDSSFGDNATDTVPTENATRIYLERRLGLTHTGAVVPSGQLIPAITGGFMSLDGQLAMKGDMDLDSNRVVNVGDPITDQDAVNLRSLTWDNFQDFSGTDVIAGDIVVFTGVEKNAINATVIGDVTFDLRTGVDSTLNQVDVQLTANSIINADVNTAAGIEQSKLSMTLASARSGAPTGSAAVKQAASGLASFDDTQFTVTDGYVTVKDNGIAISKLAQLGTTKVLGNPSTISTANVSAVDFSDVVNLGQAIKKSQYPTAGFLRKRNSTTPPSDGDFELINMSATWTGIPENNTLVQRDSNGDFAARIADLRSLKIDGNTVLDTATSGSGGYVQLYGFNTASAGVLIQTSPVTAENVTQYRNRQHDFLTANGATSAPITASSIQVQAITTGNSITAGTITGRWTLTGTSPNESRLQATYSADLAENYEGDQEYEVGTVLVFGGDKEVTTTNIKGDTRVAGVVSNTAAYTMYEACPGFKNLVALQGRVPCKVVGKITKGDILITAGIPGVAIAASGDVKVGTVVGKALVNYDSDHIGTIEIAVGRT